MLPSLFWPASLTLLSLFTSAVVSTPARQYYCSESERAEAEAAFKNCVESAQSDIVSSAANAASESAGLCNALDNMLSVCQKQKEQLAECKGDEHAENIKRLHLSVTADIIKSLNAEAEVEKCAAFSPKTATPFRPGGGHGEDEEGGAGHAHLSAAAVSASGTTWRAMVVAAAVAVAVARW